MIKTHGMSGTKIYNVWKTMKSRCRNDKNGKYKVYGGRGIKLEWESFQDFYKDMGKGYKTGLSMERIDNNGNYCKKNCRWATYKEQARNTSRNLKLLVNGGIMCARDVEKRFGLTRGSISQSIKRGKPAPFPIMS